MEEDEEEEGPKRMDKARVCVRWGAGRYGRGPPPHRTEKVSHKSNKNHMTDQ